MQLVYASAGRDQAAWVIDVVEQGFVLKGDADCAKLGIRRRAGQTEADESRLCVDRDTLYAWDAAARDFEVPDGTASTGWRTEQVFELRAIR